MNTIQEKYTPLQWDEFDTAIMYIIYRGESRTSLSLGYLYKGVFQWTFSLDQQELEKRCKDNKLMFEYNISYHRNTKYLTMILSFPSDLSPDIEYHQLMSSARERYPTETKKRIVSSVVKVYDPSVKFPEWMDNSLRTMIAPVEREERKLINIISPYGDHDLQRKIDTMNYYIQLGVNKNEKQITVYDDSSIEKVQEMQRYLQEKGHISEIVLTGVHLYDTYCLVIKRSTS